MTNATVLGGSTMSTSGVTKGLHFAKKVHPQNSKNPGAVATPSPSVYYFSALQPLWELQVCHRFSRLPQYFPVFMSCNEALRDRTMASPHGRPPPQGTLFPPPATVA